MTLTHLKIAVRYLLRNKAYTCINVLGLAVGLACCILIMMYVQDELSFDHFHEKGDQIYRVALDRKYPGRMRSYAIIPQSYSHTFKEEFPEVDASVRLFYFQNNVITLKYGGQTYEEEYGMWADSNFFDIFTIKLLEGEKNKALKDPNTVILTESIAKKYFGEENAIGKVLDNPNSDNDLVVTGVCEDVPKHSHLRFDILMSSTSLNFLEQTNYVNFSAFTYLMLKEGTDYKTVEAKFPEIVKKYASGEIQRQFNQTYEDYVAAGNGYEYYLQPLKKIYLYSNLENEIRPPGSITRVYIFTVIAIFILVIAIINFMNLSTARSTERAREVGIRKTLGSLRGQIAIQFLLEATVISMIGMFIAFVLLILFIPTFNIVSGKELTFSSLFNIPFLSLILFASLFVGLLAGSYPSMVLSSFKPMAVLRAKLLTTKKGFSLRNGLVVFQFAISVILIISTIVVYNQLQFIRNKELGFNKDQVLTIQGAFALQTKTEAFTQELNKLPEIESVATCNVMPGGYFFGTSFRRTGEAEAMFGSGIVVDNNYIECMQMELLDGRNFSNDYNDSLTLLINETAAKELQLENPVGERLITVNPNQQGEEITTEYTIVGLVKDFHFQSLHQQISPVYFYNSEDRQNGVNGIITLRISSEDIQNSLQKVENLWTQFQPNQPFRFTFFDADLSELYYAEQVAQKVFGLFALLAIFIACMGLLGLAAYITQQRTKEIGVRKVLGASVNNIVSLLSRDFLKLVLISLVVASPIAWYTMNRWLESFAYRIDVSWWIFILAGILAIFIAFVTVSAQSIRAAFANPVHALRNE